MTKDSYVEYSKRRNPSASEDGWAKLKNWKDPTAENRGYVGDTPLSGSIPKRSPVPNGRNKPTDSIA